MSLGKAIMFIRARFFIATLIFMAVVMAGARVGDAWNSISSGKLFSAIEETVSSSSASAQDPPKPSSPAPASVKAAKDEKSGDEQKAPKTQPPPLAEKPSDTATGSGASIGSTELLKQLSARRDQLDKRERDMDTREALLKVAEQRVDQKIREMETLRTQLQSMVNQASAAQQAQMENLVKIYETMKPKEAARIFETLEMPVLLGVVQKMKAVRTAAVMAELPPEKARELTIAITRQDQLPQIK